MKVFVISVYDLISQTTKISQECYRTLDEAVAFIKSRADYNGDSCVKQYRKLLTKERLYEIHEISLK